MQNLITEANFRCAHSHVTPGALSSEQGCKTPVVLSLHVWWKWDDGKEEQTAATHFGADDKAFSVTSIKRCRCSFPYYSQQSDIYKKRSTIGCKVTYLKSHSRGRGYRHTICDKARDGYVTLLRLSIWKGANHRMAGGGSSAESDGGAGLEDPAASHHLSISCIPAVATPPHPTPPPVCML